MEKATSRRSGYPKSSALSTTLNSVDPAARFIVSGKVQGVCFRASTREHALKHGLCGSARNLADGRVEVVASGDAAALDALAQWLQRGPAWARVDGVSRTAWDGQPAQGFVIG